MLGKIVRPLLAGFAVLVLCSTWAVSSSAEPPALARLTGTEKERVAKLIEGAKKEGEVVGYTSSWHPDVQEKMIPLFREQYGLSESDLKIRLVSTRTGAIVTKITEELRAKVYKTDFAQTAPAFWFDELIARGEIMAYDCPEYKHFSPLLADPKVGPANPPYYISAQNTLFALSYNPKYIKKEIVHWKDVLRPEHEGKIICGDVSTSFSLIEAYLALRKVLGKSFFEELGKLRPFLSTAQTDMASKCVSGEFPVNVISSQSIVFRANEKGGGLKLVFPPEGWALTGYPTAILARAPHPNAAKLFIDFLHGQPGQDFLMNFGGNASGRFGVKSRYANFPKPIYELKGAIEMDWRKVTKQDREEAREESRKLLKGGR
jgi:iron(III) transport system substrate-binding protein